MTSKQAIKEVSVAVDMHDTDKANEGWKVIKKDLEILETILSSFQFRNALYNVAIDGYDENTDTYKINTVYPKEKRMIKEYLEK